MMPFKYLGNEFTSISNLTKKLAGQTVRAAKVGACFSEITCRINLWIE